MLEGNAREKIFLFNLASDRASQFTFATDFQRNAVNTSDLSNRIPVLVERRRNIMKYVLVYSPLLTKEMHE